MFFQFVGEIFELACVRIANEIPIHIGFSEILTDSRQNRPRIQKTMPGAYNEHTGHKSHNSTSTENFTFENTFVAADGNILKKASAARKISFFVLFISVEIKLLAEARARARTKHRTLRHCSEINTKLN